MAFALWYIYDKIITNNDLYDIRVYFEKVFAARQKRWMLYLAFLLLWVNWGIEAVKWRYLVEKIERMSFFRSFLAILAGSTVTVFTPNRIGEYAGRVMYIRRADRIEAALITVIGSVAQFVITTITGSFAVLFFLSVYRHPTVSKLSFYIGLNIFVVMTIVLIGAFINTPLLTLMLSRIKRLYSRFKKYVDVFSYYDHSELINVLLMSSGRYIIFSLQYWLVLSFYGVNIGFGEALVFIPVYFLALTFIPTIALAELGVREAVSVALFSMVSGNELGIVSASFTIWLINLAFPALLGMVSVLRVKLIK